MTNLRTEAREMLQIGMPIVIGQLGIIAMNVADTIQVGMIEGKGTAAVAAAGLGGSLFFTIAVIGIIALGVVAPMISKAKAEEKNEDIRRYFLAAQRVAWVMSGVIFIIVSLLNLKLSLFGQESEVTELAQPFTFLIAGSGIPLLLFTALRQLSDGLGKTHLARQATITALILNVFLNWVLILGNLGFPRLEVIGSGFATLISRTFMCLYLWYRIKDDPDFSQYFQKTRTSIADLTVLGKKILKIGLPAGLQGFFEIAVFTAAVVVIGWYGKAQQAAHMIAINMCAVTYMMVTGIATAGGIRVGHFWGLRDRSAMQIAGNVALGISGVFMLLAALFFVAFNQKLVALYTTDAAVVPVASSLLLIGAIFQISDGLQATALGILRGVADVKVPTAITLFAYWIVGLPVGYVLGSLFNLKAQGVWLGLTAGLTASALLLCWRFYRILKRVFV